MLLGRWREVEERPSGSPGEMEGTGVKCSGRAITIDLPKTPCSYVHPSSAHTYFPEENECTCPPEDICKNIRSSLIHNSPKLDTVQMSTQEGRDKQTIEGAASRLRIHSAVKKNGPMIHAAMWGLSWPSLC